MNGRQVIMLRNTPGMSYFETLEFLSDTCKKDPALRNSVGNNNPINEFIQYGPIRTYTVGGSTMICLTDYNCQGAAEAKKLQNIQS